MKYIGGEKWKVLTYFFQIINNIGYVHYCQKCMANSGDFCSWKLVLSDSVIVLSLSVFLKTGNERYEIQVCY